MPLLTDAQRLERLRARAVELNLWRDRAHVDLDEWTWDGRRLGLGEPWPKGGLHVAQLAHPEVTVPETWPLRDTRLELDVGGEGLLTITYEGGGQQSWGVDPYHNRWRLHAPTFSLHVEAVARYTRGEPVIDPRLRRARIVHADAGLERLARLVTLVAETGEALGEDEVVDPL